MVQAVPYLLGFQPERSVVLMGYAGPRHRLVVTARLDLDAPVEAAEPWFAAASREGCDQCLLVLYDNAIKGRPWAYQERVDEWEALADAYALSMTDALAVGEGRWWSFRCPSNSCCPDDGTPLAVNGSVAAAAVSCGLVAASSRSDLVAELAADPVRVAKVCDAMAAIVDRDVWRLTGAPGAGSTRRQRAESLVTLETLLKTYRESPKPCRSAEAARTLLALVDLSVRDAMIASVPIRENTMVLEFWRDLTQCAPEGFVAAPATLYALCAFAVGDGARANVGVERALADRPGYRMAELLDAAISGGMKPDTLIPDLVAGAAKERTKLARRGRRAGCE